MVAVQRRNGHVLSWHVDKVGVKTEVVAVVNPDSLPAEINASRPRPYSGGSVVPVAMKRVISCHDASASSEPRNTPSPARARASALASIPPAVHAAVASYLLAHSRYPEWALDRGRHRGSGNRRLGVRAGARRPVARFAQTQATEEAAMQFARDRRACCALDHEPGQDVVRVGVGPLLSRRRGGMSRVAQRACRVQTALGPCSCAAANAGSSVKFDVPDVC